MWGHVVAFGLHAAEHEGTARTDDDRTLRRDGLVDGEHLYVGDKIGAVRIGCALRHSRDVAGPPQVDGALHRGRPVHRRFGHTPTDTAAAACVLLVPLLVDEVNPALHAAHRAG